MPSTNKTNRMAAQITMNPFSSSKYLRQITAAVVVYMSLITPFGVAYANPVSGNVVGGSATIRVDSPTRVTINQTTDRAIINWNSFSIGSGEQTVFQQPSINSITLNRVIGADPSRILGQITANGRVVLVNPNGVFFGKDSKVDVAALIASTHDIKNEDFMAGNLRFNIPGKPNAGIINEGTITAKEGGLVALVAPWVHNSGLIQAKLGKVALAASNGVTIDLYGDNLITFEADSKTLGSIMDTEGKPVTSLVQMDGRIEAYGGTVLLTANAAKGIVDRAINMTGHIQATTVDTSTGKILLRGGDGTLEVSGTLDASAPGGGDGGFIDTSAAHVTINPIAQITTASRFGKIGQWLIDPTDYIIGAGGDIRAADLVNYLNTNNIEIQTAATGIENGDIYVNEAVNWSSLSKLTLTAHKNIYVNQLLNAAGGGSLKLRSDSNGSGTGSVYFGSNGHITANGGAVAIYYNPASYTNSASKSDNGSNPYSAKATLNGGSTMDAFMLVNNVNQLQAMNTNLAGHYALGRDIEASATLNWNGGAGFKPVGYDTDNIFSGVFDGQGHVVKDLFIYRPNDGYVGLFGHVADSSIRNTGIVGGSITGHHRVGGLIGYQSSGVVDNSYSNINIKVNEYQGGGLVGSNSGTINNSFSLGTVDADDNPGQIQRTEIGGLVGFNSGGSINNSFSRSTVIGGLNVGGLVGLNYSGTINNSFSAGRLIITPLYNCRANIGGLVSSSDGSIINSYSTTELSLDPNIITPNIIIHEGKGGLVGGVAGLGDIQGSYWNTDFIYASNPEGAGLTTAQMKQQANYVGWDFTNTWTIQNGVSYPTLRTSSAPGSLVLQPGVIPSGNTVQMFTKYNGASAVTLLNGILASELRNDPTNPVWHALYQNGSATSNQIEANRLWNIYDDYKTASAETLVTAIKTGIFTAVNTDPVWNALSVNPNRQAALDLITSENAQTSTACQANPQLCTSGTGTTGGGTVNPPTSDLASFETAFSRLSTIGGTGADIFSKVMSLNFMVSDTTRLNLLRNAVRALLDGSGANSYSTGSLNNLLSAIDNLSDVDPELASKFMDAAAKKDWQAQRMLLADAKYFGEPIRKLTAFADGLGYFFSGLSATLDTAELTGKVVAGTAGGEDLFKWISSMSTNGLGLYVGSISAAGGAVGIAPFVLAGYSGIGLGKTYAEWQQGESFSDSQQRYIDNIRSNEQNLMQFEHNQIIKYAQGVQSYPDNGAIALGKSIVQGQIDAIDQSLNDLNSWDNRLGAGLAFESGSREKIVAELSTKKANLTNMLLQYEKVALNQYKMGIKIKEENASMAAFEILKNGVSP